VTGVERALLRLARPYAGRILGAGLLAMTTELAGLALMTTATWMLVTAAGAPPLSTLAIAIVMVRALAVSRGALRYGERLASHDAVLRLLTEVRARVFAGLAARHGPTRPGLRTPDALSRLVSDVDAVQDLVVRVAVPAGAAVVVALVAAGATALVSVPAALVLALGLAVAGGGLPILAARLSRRTAAAVAPLRGEYAVDTVDLVRGAADLAAYGRTRDMLARADTRARELGRLERRLAVLGGLLDAAGIVVTGASAALVVAVAHGSGVSGVMVGVLAVGTLAAGESTLALVGAARRRTEIRPALDRVAGLLTPTEPGASAEPAAPAESAAADAEDVTASTLAARDVTVHFGRGDRPVLSNVSLTIEKGQRIAIVGPSGAGKSTLLAVLAGVLEPGRPGDGVTGTVEVDGVPLASIPPRLRHRVVGGLFADAYVFHASVRDNLRLGRPDADDEAIAAACDAAELTDWIRDRPAGLDTVVGEDGSQLSGGERQRLALARALLSRPAILLLDEPTEGLDPAAADRVLSGVLAAAGPARAVVVVTHRLSIVDTFDEVLVIDAGRITQRGHHDDLLRAPGWYRTQHPVQDLLDHEVRATKSPRS
jgi:ATP-binding cassette subfamily C protein CydC